MRCNLSLYPTQGPSQHTQLSLHPIQCSHTQPTPCTPQHSLDPKHWSLLPQSAHSSLISLPAWHIIRPQIPRKLLLTLLVNISLWVCGSWHAIASVQCLPAASSSHESTKPPGMVQYEIICNKVTQAENPQRSAWRHGVWEHGGSGTGKKREKRGLEMDTGILEWRGRGWD